MATVEAPRVEPRIAPGLFRNEPATDFTKEENKTAMRAAIEKVRGELGREYDLVIGGQRVKTKDNLRSINPANPSELVGLFSKAGAAEVEPAMTAALKAFESWSRTSAEERAGLLLRTAELIRKHKHEFSAWMIFEVSKNYAEADADTCETIDFLEFYAREALRLAKAEPPLQLPGERDYLHYIPLGVGIVVPPWNFPGAIMAGMTSASIVAGNTVILKPSSDSPAIAAFFFSLLEEAGMPPGVVNFCPGAGATFGDALVSHPKSRFIAFTGSKEVGLHVNQMAAKTGPGQIWVKRVIAEMGGKNSIVVDSEADLEAAVEGVTVSAFGYQGQKCSACSRAIVVESVYEAFLEKLQRRVAQIKVGPATRPDSYMGPVINARAKQSILDYIEIGKREGRLVTGGEEAPGRGYFIQPTVIADVAPQARIAQEEIFGPVLAVIKARNFDEALEIANHTEYGLTGAVYTKNRQKLKQAAEDFFVGNLYFNRKCTGALVGGHPFGGFNMSGTDSKAGGRDYLLLFTQAKVVSERVAG